jgi:periplasmic protein TonB
MTGTPEAASEMFSLDEIARAAGVARAAVRGLLSVGAAASPSSDYVPFPDAVRLVREIRTIGGRPRRAQLFAAAPAARRRRGTPLAVSGALHALVVLIFLTMGGADRRTAASRHVVPDTPRLIFLMTPGPGGGGGGGGQRQPSPPARARLQGQSVVSSPVTVAAPPDARDEVPTATTRAAAPAPDPETAPPAAAADPVSAPVVSAAADDAHEPGLVLDHGAAQPAGAGPGGEHGIGAGHGTGSGRGDGAGIGDGWGGGTGGGPYRPGSGVTPPSLLREVKPAYTDDARRQGVEGSVLLEVVVRADGTVGEVRIMRRLLGTGLDERAVDAVRQWLFSPAERFGTPVDVLVEVAVEFRMR